MSNLSETLVKKYDQIVPNYNSYPTSPYWSGPPDEERWIEFAAGSLSPVGSTWSIYIHVPFCETPCTYCGCNRVITRNHGVEESFVELVLKEWRFYLSRISGLRERPLRGIYLGGGTPNFLSSQNLRRLIGTLLSDCQVDQKRFEGSIEIDPRRATSEQFQVLRDLGFNRVSIGVQDFDPEVQEAINRSQSYESIAEVVQRVRELGYRSVNFDLIYGLPGQTLQSMRKTIAQTISLKPDRLALFRLALAPWSKPQKTLYENKDLPVGLEKFRLYELSRDLLLKAGYADIGVDHFALPHDTLAIAAGNGTLHRNFMGYNDQKTDLLLGLGPCSISETARCFHQNHKDLSAYSEALSSGKLPTQRGHVLSAEDQRRQKQILQLLTSLRTEFESDAQRNEAETFFRDMQADGLVKVEGSELRVTSLGRLFLRNICMFFDERLKRSDYSLLLFTAF